MLSFREFLRESDGDKVQPKTKKELIQIIKDTIDKEGYYADLNFIDTSRVTDMSGLFHDIPDFNGDISKWNTSKVETMESMFDNSLFKGDISKWDVHNVENMWAMFSESVFNSDISKWNVRKVKNMSFMFHKAKFNQDISKWDVRNAENLAFMFNESKFNQDISKWRIRSGANTNEMFKDCPLEKKPEFQPKKD